MLLEYRVNNYKSFGQLSIFNMIPNKKLRNLKYSILEKKIGKNDYTALSSSVIYGPNAAGKTSIIGALEVLKGIVLDGSIRNKERNTGNIAVNRLELIPNINMRQPVTLGVKAINENIKFDYEISFCVESIIDKNVKREIVEEKLYVNEKEIYQRKKNLVSIINLPEIKFRNTSEPIDQMEKIALKVNEEELFLTENFKAFYSNEIVRIIQEWFEKKLVIIVDSETTQYLPKFEVNEKIKHIGSIDDMAKAFGSTANALLYLDKKDGAYPELYSVIDMGNNKQKCIPAEIYESLGTRCMASLFPIIILSILEGRTLLVDELDASIHPMAIMSIVNAFHNDEINKNKAQLIFNTHNPIYLNKNLFRTDEIKFVDRDENTKYSEVYALSDFGTAGDTRARQTSNYMKNYFVSKYGAIKDIDFTPIFMKVFANQKKEK